jgi:PAS domain-containing protein
LIILTGFTRTPSRPQISNHIQCSARSRGSGIGKASGCREARARSRCAAERVRRAQAQERLEELNRWFNIVLNNMARGLSMFDANQRLVVCNKTYRENYALPKRLARPGTTLAQLVRHHVNQESGRDGPEESKKQREWIARHVAELARGKTLTHTQHLKSGRVIWRLGRHSRRYHRAAQS